MTTVATNILCAPHSMSSLVLIYYGLRFNRNFDESRNNTIRMLIDTGFIKKEEDDGLVLTDDGLNLIHKLRYSPFLNNTLCAYTLACVHHYPYLKKGELMDTCTPDGDFLGGHRCLSESIKALESEHLIERSFRVVKGSDHKQWGYCVTPAGHERLVQLREVSA